jgi:hypothetical protein
VGAENNRRGCYRPLDGAIACEFYLPHDGENFGILFTGGFHPIWYEYEWVYNATWKSWL